MSGKAIKIDAKFNGKRRSNKSGEKTIKETCVRTIKIQVKAIKKHRMKTLKLRKDS